MLKPTLLSLFLAASSLLPALTPLQAHATSAGGRVAGPPATAAYDSSPELQRAVGRIINEQAKYAGPGIPPPLVEQPYKIPVVFHWIRAASPYNYTAAQIQQKVLDQLRALNRDFRKLNQLSGTTTPEAGTGTNSLGNTVFFEKNSANGVTTDPGLAADANIEFVLANTKPDGTCMTYPTGITIPGIEISSNTTSYTITNTAAGEFDVLCAEAKRIKRDSVSTYTHRGMNAWDPAHYLNIWVADIRNGGFYQSGFCIPPTTWGKDPRTGINAPSVTENPFFYLYDGIVLHPGVVGGPTAAAPYSAAPDLSFPTSALPWAGRQTGRTLVHEIGHYFNLWHIWGLYGISCGDDMVADTPLQGTKNNNCETIPSTTASCGSGLGAGGTMYMNFMDYSNDECSNAFTVQQVARMRETLLPGAIRSSLLEWGNGFGFQRVDAANNPVASPSPRPTTAGTYVTVPTLQLSRICTSAGAVNNVPFKVTLYPASGSCRPTTNTITYEAEIIPVETTTLPTIQSTTWTSTTGTITVNFPAGEYSVDVEVRAKDGTTLVGRVRHRVLVHSTTTPSYSAYNDDDGSCTYKLLVIKPSRTTDHFKVSGVNQAIGSPTYGQTVTFWLNSLGGYFRSSDFYANPLTITTYNACNTTGIASVFSPVFASSSCNRITHPGQPAPSPVTAARLQIAPNPAHDEVSFLLDEHIPTGLITIRKITGEVVRTFNVSESQAAFSTRALSEGTYLVEFRDASQVKHQTLIVQH